MKKAETEKKGHTPGPWQTNGVFVGTAGPDPQTVAYVDDHRNKSARSTPESLANARLIAAAPDLLEALKRAKASIDGATFINTDSEAMAATCGVIDAAITKAQG